MDERPSKKDLDSYVQFWHQSALDNLKTAESLLKSKRYNFAMFMCQQSLEAILKLCYVRSKEDRPPFLHKLPRLLFLTGIKVPAWADEIILEVDAHYIKARYFADRFDKDIYNHKNASKLLRDTKKVIEWFVLKLKLEK